MNKEKNYKEHENEVARGKKRYQERLIEDEEAQRLIDEYKKHPQEPNDAEEI
jgi:hypothetical protein